MDVKHFFLRLIPAVSVSALTLALPVDSVKSAAELPRLKPQTTLTECINTLEPSITAALFSLPEAADIPLSMSEKAALLDACASENIDPSLALGLIYVESRFTANAVSPAGCYGYCQLNPRYFPAGLFPEENISAGVHYLGSLLQYYDCLDAALTAYHDGHDTGRRVYANAVLTAAGRFLEDRAQDKLHG